MNETYQIEFSSPLLRPGIIIRTNVSKRYVESTISDVLTIIRNINNREDVNNDKSKI